MSTYFNVWKLYSKIVWSRQCIPNFKFLSVVDVDLIVIYENVRILSEGIKSTIF